MITRNSITNYQGPSLMRTADFIFFLPHPLLRPYITNYMLTCPASMPDGQTIMPTASSTLVLSVGSRDIITSLRGVNTRSYEIATYAQQFPLLLLVEFHPAGLYPFIKQDQTELTDSAFLFNELDTELDTILHNAFLSADSVYSLICQLDAIFLSRLHQHALPPALLLAMDQISRHRGLITAGQLSNEVYYSERQLNRMFQKYIGTGTKTFTRIARVNYMLNLLDQSPVSSLELAEQGGYYDASHMLKDFKEICGITPGEYQKNLSVFYNDPFKMQ